MKVRNSIIAGLIGLASFTPVKAQKAVQYIPEVGISGVVHNDALYYGGMNVGLTKLKGKNFTDLFAGVGIKHDGQPSFIALVINNYNWTKHISSWTRGVASVSENGLQSTLEVSPIKANLKVKNLDLSINPAYTVNNNFKNNDFTQGINFIGRSIYKVTPKDELLLELKYQTKPTPKLLDTHFDKFRNNFAFMASWLKYL